VTAIHTAAFCQVAGSISEGTAVENPQKLSAELIPHHSLMVGQQAHHTHRVMMQLNKNMRQMSTTAAKLFSEQFCICTKTIHSPSHQHQSAK